MSKTLTPEEQAHLAQINEAIYRVTGVGIADLAGLQGLIRDHLRAVEAETQARVRSHPALVCCHVAADPDAKPPHGLCPNCQAAVDGLIEAERERRDAEWTAELGFEAEDGKAAAPNQTPEKIATEIQAEMDLRERQAVERCARIICPACGGRLEQYESVPVADYHRHVKTASTFLCRASAIRDAK